MKYCGCSSDGDFCGSLAILHGLPVSFVAPLRTCLDLTEPVRLSSLRAFTLEDGRCDRQFGL